MSGYQPNMSHIAGAKTRRSGVSFGSAAAKAEAVYAELPGRQSSNADLRLALRRSGSIQATARTPVCWLRPPRARVDLCAPFDPNRPAVLLIDLRDHLVAVGRNAREGH